MNSDHRTSAWNFKGLINIHLVILLLVGSLIVPWTFSYWFKLDMKVFESLNQTLQWGEGWRIYWAFANHHLSDWIEDIVIFIFYLIAIFDAPKEKRIQRSAQFLFCLLLTATVIISINRLFFHDIIHLKRYSPTLTVDYCIRLKQEVSWLAIKDVSSKCFPADHGTLALLFSLTYALFVKKRFSIPAIIYSLYLCLPRLIVGAHWLSDIIVGSFSITLFAIGWTFYTPLGLKIIKSIERMITYGLRQINMLFPKMGKNVES